MKELKKVINYSSFLIGLSITNISNSKFYNVISHKLGITWLFEKIISVDTNKIKKRVLKFKQKYPHRSSEYLANKMIKNKALYVGSIGFASGIVPMNIPAIIFDLVTGITAQAELIYEIALIYGMDLDDETRKGEVLTLIALGAGSTKIAESTFKIAVDVSSKKVGEAAAHQVLKSLSIALGEKVAKRFLAKLIPFVSALLGATLNASMIYLVGKGAKAYYKEQNTHIYNKKLPESLKQIYAKEQNNK